MGNYHRGELLKVLLGGSKSFRRTLHAARRMYDKGFILPETAQEWEKLDAQEHRSLLEVQHRRDAVVCYRALLAAGKTKAAAAAGAGHNRETLRRWEKRLREEGERGLLSRSRARRNAPERTARTAEAFAFVRALRQHHTDGKEVLCERMRREGFDISASSVGRIIRELRERDRRNLVKPPLLFREHRQPRRQRRPHARRRKDCPQVSAPGYAQMDTKSVFLIDRTLYIFAVRDVLTRAIYPMVASNATAASALRALEYAEHLAGYRFTDIQTDNGSEFRGVFEEGLSRRDTRHHLIPVRSPKWNSLVENAFGYLSCSVLNINAAIVPTVADLQQVLDRELARYNDKPNTSLAYVCPETGKRRLRTPNEILYTSLLSAGRTKPTPALPSMC